MAVRWTVREQLDIGDVLEVTALPCWYTRPVRFRDSHPFVFVVGRDGVASYTASTWDMSDPRDLVGQEVVQILKERGGTTEVVLAPDRMCPWMDVPYWRGLLADAVPAVPISLGVRGDYGHGTIRLSWGCETGRDWIAFTLDRTIGETPHFVLATPSGASYSMGIVGSRLDDDPDTVRLVNHALMAVMEECRGSRLQGGARLRVAPRARDVPSGLVVGILDALFSSGAPAVSVGDICVRVVSDEDLVSPHPNSIRRSYEGYR